jgi:N6-adenosine-specific RNA methylase IME4
MSKYRVIVADCPWQFSDKLTMSDVKRGGASHYDTMTTAALCSIPVETWCDDDSVLALWFPAALINDAIMVTDAWKFKVKQIYTWVKTTKNNKLAFGMGSYFRGCSEYALLATRGKPKVVSKSERNVSLSISLGHSKKPEQFQDSLEKMFPEGPYLELFARRTRPGWTCVGLESPDVKVDIRLWQPNQ